jgi:opacity protein-like surface antigen
MIVSRVSALLGATLAAALLASASSGGFAADFGYSIKDAPPPAPGRAWYLKGTIGMGNANGDMWHPSYESGNFTIQHEEMKTSPLAGIGIGMEYNRWLRLDVTGEYRGRFVFFGQDKYINGPCGTSGNCGTNEVTADIEAWVGLANAYIDLTTWRGLTPYIGGGVGFASVGVNGLKDVNVPNNGVAYADDKTTTNFAWALYAGVSFDVTPQLTMDFGYRYLDMGSASSGTLRRYDGSGCQCTAFDIEDIASHDILFSARYQLDRPVASYMPIK